LLDRRRFLRTATTGLAASLALRGNLFAQLEKIPPLPDHSLLETNNDKNQDAYWAEMRKQFLIPEDEIYLNNGTVGSSPAPVLRAIFDGYSTTEKMDAQDPEDYPIWDTPRGTSFAIPWPRSSAAIAMRLPCCAMPRKRTATSPMAST